MTYLLVFIGLVTGLLTGLTGASGMSVLISSLLLIGLDVRDIIGLTFAVTLANGAAAMGPYIRKGQWDKRLALAIGLPAVGAVFLGDATGRAVPAMGLTAIMTAALFCVGIRFLFFHRGNSSSGEETGRRPSLAVLVLLGLSIGTIMGMLGGGGSIFISISLILLFRIPLRIALGTSIVIMVMTAVPGILLSLRQGHLDLRIALLLIGPGVLAGFAAAHIANRVSERSVQLTLGGYLVVVSLVLLMRLINA